MPQFDPHWAITGFAVTFNEQRNGSGQVMRPLYDYLSTNPASLYNLLMYADEYTAVSSGFGGTWVYSGGLTVRSPRRIRVEAYMQPGLQGAPSDAEVTALTAALQAEYDYPRRATILDVSNSVGQYGIDLAARALSALVPFQTSTTLVDWSPFIVLLPPEGSFADLHETARASGTPSLFDWVIKQGCTFGVPCFVDQAEAEQSGDMVSYIDAINRGVGDGRLPWLYRRIWTKRSSFRYSERIAASLYTATPGIEAPWRVACAVVPFFDATERNDAEDYTCVMPPARYLDLLIWRTLRAYPNLANIGVSWLNADSEHITTSAHTQAIVDLFTRYCVGRNNGQGTNFVAQRPGRPVQRLYPSNARVPPPAL